MEKRSETELNTHPLILIVDDTPKNLQLLGVTLSFDQVAPSSTLPKNRSGRMGCFGSALFPWRLMMYGTAHSKPRSRVRTSDGASEMTRPCRIGMCA